MKVFFNRVEKREPWGGGTQFLNALCDFLRSKGHEVTFHLEENIDVIFMIDPRPGGVGYSVNHILNYKSHFPNTKIIYRINECDARKNTSHMDNIIIQSASHVDKVIFISEWLKNYFLEKGMNAEDSSVIYNGCNLKHFYPSNEPTLKTGKLSLVTHHWSDNWLKGHDLYKFIDNEVVGENYDFTYIGRYCTEYTPRNINLIEPLWGEKLGEEIRKHDIYVTASRFEPCGMHHIEGAASGLPVIYHKDCGGIVEMCRNHGKEYETFHEFIVALNEVSENLKNYQQKIKYERLDIDNCCKKFYEEIVLANQS